ncbi:MAG: murein biosynthesis integral membrane protein MurJ [Chloroflexota bacterium]
MKKTKIKARAFSHLGRSAIILAVFFGIDKIFSFARSMIITRQFGLSSFELDAFNAANNIPDLLSALISGGALGVALIPVLSEYMESRGRKAVWDLFSRILNFAFLVTGLIALVVVLIAPWLAEKLIVGGFSTEYQQLTVDLMRLDMIAIMIFSISGLVMAGLQANQHFLLPALAPTMYNIGQIFGALILAPAEPTQLGPITLPGYGLGIHGLVYGVIIGAAMHLLIQTPALKRYEFKWAPRVNLRDPGVRQVLTLLGPRVLTMFFIQTFYIYRDFLASFMDQGSITALNLGWFIMQVPETMLGTTIAITILPTISEIFSSGDIDQFKATVNGAIRAVLALTVPVGLLLIAGMFPMVQATYAPDPIEAARVVLATRIYLLGLTGHALLEISSRSFYSQQDAKTPLIAAAINAALYFMIASLFTKWFDFAGIALANVLAFSLEALLLLYLLNRRFPGITKSFNTLIKALLPSALAALGVYFILQLPEVKSLSILTQAAVSSGLMLLGLLISAPFVWKDIKQLLQLGKRTIA